MFEVFVLSSADVGASATLVRGAALGRVDGNTLVLRDRSISRRHAVVEEREGVLWLVDAGSTNGLTLAGVRVEAVELDDGVEFKAGDVELRVRVKTEPKPRPKRRAPAPKPSAASASAGSAAAAESEAPTAPPADEPVFSFGGGVADASSARATSASAKASVPGATGDLDLEFDFDFEDELDPPAEAPAAPTRTQVSNAERAKILANLDKRQTSFLGADLAQYPAWLQALALLAVLALGAGAVYLAFTLVQSGRG